MPLAHPVMRRCAVQSTAGFQGDSRLMQALAARCRLRLLAQGQFLDQPPNLAEVGCVTCNEPSQELETTRREDRKNKALSSGTGLASGESVRTSTASSR